MAQGHASTSPAELSARIAVLMPLPLDGAYDYAVPPGMVVAPGDFVTVPLGTRPATGAAPRPGLFRLAVERGWTLYELHQEGGSLEELFRELTTGSAT